MAEELLRVIEICGQSIRLKYIHTSLLTVGSGAEEGRENAEESRVLGHCSAADV